MTVTTVTYADSAKTDVIVNIDGARTRVPWPVPDPPPPGLRPDVVATLAACGTPAIPTVTADMVVAERKRRLARGFDHDFGAPRGVHHFATTEEDLAGWSEVAEYAAALEAKGDKATKISIVTETGHLSVTAADWRAVQLSAAAFRQPIWAASFVLAEKKPIPADYANDKYWP